jgi:hypothetical protein
MMSFEPAKAGPAIIAKHNTNKASLFTIMSFLLFD